MARLVEITGKAISGEWGQEDSNGTGIPVLRTTNFTNEGVVNYDNVVTRCISKKNIETKFLQAGDIIIEKSGGSDKQPVGRVIYFEGEENKYLFNNFTGLLRVKDTNKWVPRYVFYSLYSNYLNGGTRPYENRTTGLHNLQTDSYVTTTEVRDVSLGEQEQIVRKLDCVANLISKRREQLAKLDGLVKARFVEMFGRYPENEKEWSVGSIRDVVSDVRYGSSRPAVEGGKYPYLRMNNITYGGELDLTDVKRIDVPENELEKCTVRKGDVLFNRTNSRELVGKTCVYNRDELMVLAGFVIRVRVNEMVLPEFLSAYLNTDFSKQMLQGMCKTAIGQANINAQELQNIKLYLPPIYLQQQFADFVSQVDRSKAAVERSLASLETLKKSLMQQYFG